MASQARVFSLLGDSNVHPHINKTSCRAHSSLKGAQVLTCGHLGIFSGTLEKIKADADACIVACLTNFLTGAEGHSTVSHRVDPVLQQFRETLVEFCTAFPTRHFLISPPMYREGPTWYREGLPEILTLFSACLATDRPPNLHLLPSFPTPQFDLDGVHLTAYSGLEYVLHLFDSSLEVFAGLEAAPSEVAVKSAESTRVLEDRVMALEQDHRRLNRVVEVKTAADAELADFHKNEKFEDSFLISGLPRIPSEVIGKAWQDQAVKDVKGAILALMGRDYPVVFVQNATSRVPNAEVRYNVKMSTVADSRFTSFYLISASDCVKTGDLIYFYAASNIHH